MPILVTDYELHQTLTHLTITIATKSVAQAKIDVVVTSLHVRVNFAPFLLVLDLALPVDVAGCSSVIGGGQVVLKLLKQAPNDYIWDKVLFEGGKQERFKRRLEAEEQEFARNKEVRGVDLGCDCKATGGARDRARNGAQADDSREVQGLI